MIRREPNNRAARPVVLPARTVDPLERALPLLFRLGVYGFLAYFFLQASWVFVSYDPGEQWPRLLWVFRTFTFLPLHEGGHVLFMFFGRTLHALGGSFWQIMFPLLWFVIALRQKSQVAPFPLFWVGENMMDVSLYVRDTPLMELPLLGGHKSGHDWRFLLGQWEMIDSAGDIADILYYGGVVISVAAIAAGVVWACVAFYRSGRPAPQIVAPPARGAAAIGDSA